MYAVSVHAYRQYLPLSTSAAITKKKLLFLLLLYVMALLRLSAARFGREGVVKSWRFQYRRIPKVRPFLIWRYLIEEATYTSTKFRRPSYLTKWGNPQYMRSSKSVGTPQHQQQISAAAAAAKKTTGGAAGLSPTHDKKTRSEKTKNFFPKHCDMLFLHQQDRLVRVKPHANFFIR